jgi:hypothetical protein
MRNAIPHVRMRIISPFLNIEVFDKFLADWMGVEVRMPGGLNREPELRASEPK